MDIYINSVKANFTLENEKTLGDVLKAFQIECEKNAATIVSVCMDGQQLKADRMDAVFANDIESVEVLEIETVAESDIMRALEDTGEKLKLLSDDMEQIPLLLQSGKDAKVSAILTSFADLFDILCRLISLCSLFPQKFEQFTIDGQRPVNFLHDFSPILSDFEKALADTDTVLTGDLAEYEIVPRLRSFASGVKEFKDKVC